MCGIVGYSSTSNSIELSKFVSMIKSLDYRGYDSWGFTFKDEDQLKTEKQLGKIETPNQEGSATFVIGHTRWATHGKVTENNTHPQRRIDLSLRWLTQGANDKMVKSKGKKRIHETLAEQILATVAYDQQKSFAYSKKYDIERQAKAAR